MDQHHHFLALKAMMIDFLSGYPSMINAGDATVDAYVRPVMTLSIAAVGAAINRFVRGEVPGQRIGWPPDATQFYLEAQMHHASAQPRPSLDELPPAPVGCKRLPNGDIIVPVGIDLPDGWWEGTYLPNGTTTDHGHGPIRLDGLTRREAQIIDDLGGMTPSGKNFAALTLDEKRAEIGRYLPAPASVAA